MHCFSGSVCVRSFVRPFSMRFWAGGFSFASHRRLPCVLPLTLLQPFLRADNFRDILLPDFHGRSFAGAFPMRSYAGVLFPVSPGRSAIFGWCFYTCVLSAGLSAVWFFIRGLPCVNSWHFFRPLFSRVFPCALFCWSSSERLFLGHFLCSLLLEHFMRAFAGASNLQGFGPGFLGCFS